MGTDRRETCFVIMPFGEKLDSDGKVIDFDAIYDVLIKDTVEAIGIHCMRCDRIDQTGWIHGKMFRHVYDAQVAVVDITTLNPNVFYELGVRHALNRCTTLLLRQKGTAIPFNIQGFDTIEYDIGNLRSVKAATEKITESIKNGLRTKQTDSPVHEVLDLKINTLSHPITVTTKYGFKLKQNSNRRIWVITGNLIDVKGIDIWVSSENTNMQMARYFDRSVSGVIRYYGATKKSGRIVDDTIAKEVFAATGDHCDAGEIVVTGSGELEKSNKVKKIFHAAAVTGQVGEGYVPIANIGRCIRNALREATEQSNETVALKSILFPLLGTGSARGDLRTKTAELIQAAIDYLASNADCTINDVYFLAWTHEELEACQSVLGMSKDLVAISKPVQSTTNRGKP